MVGQAIQYNTVIVDLWETVRQDKPFGNLQPAGERLIVI